MVFLCMKVHKTKKTMFPDIVFLTLTSHKNREFCFFSFINDCFSKDYSENLDNQNKSIIFACRNHS